MAIPEKFKNLAKKVRNEVYGRDVREAIAKSIEETGESSETAIKITEQLIDGSFNEAELTTEIEQRLQQLEEDYAPELNSLKTEVDNARGSESNLGSRLNSVDSQLAETEARDGVSKAQSIEPLYIETFDGTNQPYHPSVEYFPGGWNGRKFWMAYTPFPIGVPPYMDRWECPCIVSSDDGIRWIKPVNAPDPLIDLTQEEIDRGDYFSDPDIVMNGNTMEIWYRKTNGADTSITNIYRITSTDGENWSSPEMVLNAEETNNGFGAMETMRSHQLFYDGNNYTSYFSMQGGDGGFWRAETTDPSSRTWENKKQLDFTGHEHLSPFNIWHLGVYLESGVYHMTAYDFKGQTIAYFISSDGVNFVFNGTILNAESTETRNLDSLYQTIALHVNDEWLVYASGTYKGKNGIALFSGTNLNTIVPVNGGKVLNNTFFEEVPILNNSRDNNNRYYGTYVSGTEYNGYGMSFGKYTNAPSWVDNSNDRPITYVFDERSTPYLVPAHVGMFWRDVETKRVWLSVGVDSIDDWKEVVRAFERKNVTASSEIDVTGVNPLVINQGESVGVSNLTGGADEQELFVLIAPQADNITLVNNANGDGSMRLKGRENKTLSMYEGITLLNFNGTWYEK